MQDSASGRNVDPIPKYLLELPVPLDVAPPVSTRATKLPFGELSWENFEQLVERMAGRSADVVYRARYGRSGQAQEGIDVYARLSGGRHICWQARNRERITAAEIRRAVDDFLDGKWAASSERFVLCTQASLADTKLQDAIEKEAGRLRERNILFEVLDGGQLSDKLREYPEIIDDFFGRDWLVAFAGETVAASLKRPLDARRVIELRGVLAEVYEARIRQLDPGLTFEPARSVARDIRERFVSPNVDPVNVFAEPLLETDSGPNDGVQNGDQTWRFDEYEDPAHPADVRKQGSKPPETLSVPLDDWLLQGSDALLILGAPGSGKSTVLRCLALDLVRTPELFPRISERFGPRIPLLIPFALWCRLAAKRRREVGLPEVVRETFGALIPQRGLEESVVEALADERLILLIDGLDEYSDEQAARTTLATIETFVRSQGVPAIMTARPAGFRRLGSMAGHWRTARLTELTRQQQRDLATRLLSGKDTGDARVGLRVQKFFQDIERNGRLQSLAGNPLLLCGLLSVAARESILPTTRFQLFEKLMEILLEVHPKRRATAASEVESRTGAFSTDDVRSEALAKLAFDVQVGGADTGIERDDACRIIEGFLGDEDDGPGWSREKARAGARELTDVDADTSGLLVEHGPDELAFCHAAFREHLAGLELGRWTLEDQIEFVSRHADEPRWRGTIVALIQSLKRRSDVEPVLEAIQGDDGVAAGSVDRRLLLADCAFSAASRSGAVGRMAALDCLDRIETGTNEAERLELLGLALDGPRAGPVGEAIVARLEGWWPSVMRWPESLYEQLGNWPPTEDLARTLLLALQGDSDQTAAAASIAKVFGGVPEVGEPLVALVHESANPWVTAAALDALSRGWPATDGLDDWLLEAARSPSIQLRTVAALALYRRGQRGDEARDLLLSALGARWNKFNRAHREEIIKALAADWGRDRELQNACWAGVGRHGPPRFHIDYDSARSILMRIHREDPRVPRWIQEEIETRGYWLFRVVEMGGRLIDQVVSEHPNVHAALEAWFAGKSFSSGVEAAQLAAVLRSDAAKQTMIGQVGERSEFRFWPVWSLLQGWGIEDPEVSAVLGPLARILPEDRQYIAHHIQSIIGQADESFHLLMEICSLPEVSRLDFVILGFARLGDEIDAAQAVSAILPHVKRAPAMLGSEDVLIGHFHADARVRECALRRLQEASPPLVQMARAYAGDPEIATLILKRAAPLPTAFRRFLARRATQRFDDVALGQVLRHCDLEVDEHAMAQATIGLSYAALATPGSSGERADTLGGQLHAVGPDFEARRAAAFGGLVALGRLDVFAGAREGHGGEPLRIDLAGPFKDYGPVLELAAERWEDVETALGDSLVSRLSPLDDSPSSFWRSFAPYVNRSSRLRSLFLEYCNEPGVMLDAAALLALSRVSPGSSLLLDCCVQALGGKFDDQRSTPLDAARSAVFASKCLAAGFSEDPSAVSAIVEAAGELREQGGAIVGLASLRPDHEIVVREYGKLVEGGPGPGLLLCVDLWLISAQGTSEQVANAFAGFVTRRTASLWDFAQDVLDALRARLDRDPTTAEAVAQVAREHDEPNIRASAVRILATVAGQQKPDLADEFLAAEHRRAGPPRFALDILTNRIRPARELMGEALKGSAEPVREAAGSDWRGVESARRRSRRASRRTSEEGRRQVYWTREQELAVFHLRSLKLKGQLAGRITRTIRDLAEAMGRTEGSLGKRISNFDSLDPSVGSKGLWRTAKLTQAIWAEYERHPRKVAKEASEAYLHFIG